MIGRERFSVKMGKWRIVGRRVHWEDGETQDCWERGSVGRWGENMGEVWIRMPQTL